MATVSDILVRINADVSGLQRGLASAGTELKAFSSSASATGAATSKSASTIENAFARTSTTIRQRLSGVGNSITQSIGIPLSGAQLATVALGAAAIKLSTDYQAAFARIGAISNASASDVAKWQDQVLSLAGETARAPRELADALFFLSSAGLKTSQIMPALEVSAKAAAVGLGETKDVANIVASALNAYSKSGLTAAQVTDTLVAAVREGRAEPEEFATALGRILPIASQAGVSFSDVTASLAALSNVGLDVNEGVTAMRGALQAIVAPGAQASEAMGKLGLTAQDFLDVIQKQGLVGALRLLDERAKANTDTQADYIAVLRKVIPNVRALTGVLGILGQRGDEVDGVFQRVSHATGSLDEAFAKTKQSVQFLTRQAIAEAEATLIRLGQIALPLVADGLKLVNFGLKVLDPVLKFAGENAGILLGAFLGYKALTFLPGLIVNIGVALERLGFQTAANGALSFAAGLEEIAPAIASAAIPLVAFEAAGNAGLRKIDASIDKARATIVKFGVDSTQGAQGVRDLAHGLGALQGISAHGAFIPGSEQVENFHKDLDKATASAQGLFIAGTSLADLGDTMKTIGGDAEHSANAFQGLRAVASLTGQSFVDLQKDTRTALSKAQTDEKAWTDFTTTELGKAREAIAAWSTEASGNLNFVSQTFANVASDFHGDSEKIARALSNAFAKQKEFGKDLRTILHDGSRGSKLLVQQLLALGPAGAKAAHAIATGSEKARHSIEHTLAAAQVNADKTANALSKKIVGTLQDIRDVLDALANHFIPGWADKQKGAADDVKNHLDAVQGKLVAINHVRAVPTINVGGDWAHQLETVNTSLNQLDNKTIKTFVEVHTRQVPHKGGPILHAGGIVKRMHDGGKHLASDEVPAILQRGEFVIKRSSAAKLGLPTLMALNRLHDGGPVPPTSSGSTGGISPRDLEEAFARALRAERQRLVVDRRRFGRDLDQTVISDGRW